MIIDSSAIVAILAEEPEGEAFVAAIDRSDTRAMIAPTLLECSIALKKFGAPIQAQLRALVSAMQIEISPFEELHVSVAFDAYRRYGRGSGSPARLNFGDCMAYAASVVSGRPLLFKGNDFLQTDIVSAMSEIADP